jgi:hypothetical protein
MTTSFTGGCLCGAIRYECTGKPVLSVNCHCRDCQKASGGAYTASLVVPKDTLKISGEVKYYDKMGDSGQTISRGFCPNCGSALFGKPAIQPDLITIRPGTLDDPSTFQPAIDIYVASAQPWDYMNPELPKYPKVPAGS